MRVLIAVLDDLFRFALKSLFGFDVVSGKKNVRLGELPPLQPLLPLPQPKLAPLLPDTQLVSAQGSYFVCVKTAYVRTDPVAAFDNVIKKIRYGTQVNILKYGGRWGMVQVGEITGWVLKDDITSAVVDVLPRFTVGSVYDANDQQTKKLRAYIDDMFSCVAIDLPLTSAEYVTYRLARSRRSINWGEERPRLPGSWQSLLRGRQGIHMGVVPKTGSVMEYILEDQGNLLYVEAVFPDESIQLSAIDHEGLGVYSEVVLAKEVWRELRPIFIEVI